MARQAWAFLGLTYAFSWLIWIPTIRLGAGPGVGEYVLAFGASGPAVAAIFLSGRGQGGGAVRLPVCLSWPVALWLLAWAAYVANDKIRGIKPSSHLYYLIVALLAMIPAWISSGAFSRDPGVRELLRTLVYPQNWRWQAVALVFFPGLLLIPAAIVHVFGGTLVSELL